MDGRVNPVFEDSDDSESVTEDHHTREQQIMTPRVEIDAPLDEYSTDGSTGGDDLGHQKVVWRLGSYNSDRTERSSLGSGLQTPVEPILQTPVTPNVFSDLIAPEPRAESRMVPDPDQGLQAPPSPASSEGRLKSCMRPKDFHPDLHVHLNANVAPPMRYSVVSQTDSVIMSRSKSIWMSRAKQRDLSMLLSFTYFLVVVIISAAFQFTNILGSETHDNALFVYYCLIYSVAAVVLISLLILGATGNLTRDDHYKHRRKSAFMRGGIIVLGTGEVIYRSMLFMQYFSSPSECRNEGDLMLSIPGLIYVIPEIAFLFIFTRIRLNKNFTLAIVGHFMMMHLIANNLSVWIGVVVTESIEEIAHAGDEHYAMMSGPGLYSNTTSATEMSTVWDLTTEDSSVLCSQSNILTTFSPYLFPLIIEFSIMVSTMWMSIWENCGAGLYSEQFSRRRKRSTKRMSQIAGPMTDSPNTAVRRRSTRSRSMRRSDYTRERSKSTVSVVSIQKSSGYRNSNVGFILGWLVVLFGGLGTITFLYDIVSDGFSFSNDELIWYAYGGNMLISVTCILAIPITAARMSTMGTIDQETDDEEETESNHDKFGQSSSFEHSHAIDKRLMLITYFALFVFKLLCIVAAVHEGSAIVVLDGIVSIILGMMQTGFINSYAFTKISITERQRRHKPGRQGLEFIRCSELALWLINTFVLKNTVAKIPQYAAFGTTPWAILGNIFQPLTILHYFHCMICVAEVVNHAYSDKHIAKEPHALSAHDFVGY